MTQPIDKHTCALALHGGAGTIAREGAQPERLERSRNALRAALDAGWRVLLDGGTALDAVEQTVRMLEDEPLFNAGRGAVYTHEGAHEMDAAVMDGRTGLAGAVATVRGVRNPVSLARAVIERSPHVLLVGNGAEAFAREMGMLFEPDAYFHTEERYQQWQEARAKARIELDHGGSTPDAPPPAALSLDKRPLEERSGTVGAVARDSAGNLAAATSTGGMTNKRWGRVGDAPLIGAGTWADNATCAVSCTGHGEYFIRSVVAHDVHARMAYGGLSLEEACHAVVMDHLARIGGEGGLIAVGVDGSIALPFNSAGMYRAWIVEGERPHVAIWEE